MKTIHNRKVIYITKDWNDSFTNLVEKHFGTSYFEMIEECVRRPTKPQQGFTYDDIKKIDRIRSGLKDKLDSAEFEDSDIEFIQSQVATFTWKTDDIQFVEFMDYIKGLR